MTRNWKGKQIWKEEEINLLAKEYPTGKKQDLMRLFNRPFQSIMDKANRLKIFREPVWTQQDEQRLKELYPFHSNTYLSDLFEKSRDALKYKANKLGIIKHKESLQKVNSESLRKYTLDENYFANIDTPDKAYILGFLLGDGNIAKNRFRLTVHIHQQDREVLDYITHQLKTDTPIRSDSGRETMLNWYVASYKLITDLSKWGMVPKKAHIVKLPEIDSSLYPHLIRGLFDADGCISIGDRKDSCSSKVYNCTIRGNGEALEKVSRVVFEQTGVFREVHNYDGCSRYHLSGRYQIEKFAHWLYKDAPFYLSRKYNKFIEADLLSGGSDALSMLCC